MGCDIHTVAQRKTKNGWKIIPYTPFHWRSYNMFAFLAGVRNYSAVVPIADARGLPEDFERVDDYEPDVGDHSFSWLSVDELLAFDYDAPMEDRRVTVQTGPNSFNGAATCEPGQGQEMTWRTFLGEEFFENLDALKALRADRIVFGFDS